MICTKCRADKSVDDFQKTQSWCKTCVAERSAAYYWKQKALVDGYKLERGCVDCGFNSHAEALHFDHRDPKTKSFPIGRASRKHWDVLLKEIAKCDVRCANCHAIRHAEALRSGGETVDARVC